MPLSATKRAVAIQVEAKRLLVVEAEIGAAGPVVLQAVASERTGTELAAPLKALVAERGIKTRAAHVVLPEASVNHRVLQLPPMTEAERRLFLERELLREIGPGLLLGYTTIKVLEGPPRKDEVLVAAAPGEQGNPALAGVMAAGFAPRLVTSAPIALARAAEVLSPSPLERPTAVVHWGMSGLLVIVVDGGALKFTREVPHLAVPGLDPREWFITEYQRSIRQYMQTAKGAAVGGLLIGSVDPRFESTLPEVEARLGLGLVNLNDVMRGLLPDGAEEGEVLAGAFLIPLGAAALAPTGTANLLPPAILAGQRTALVKRGAAVAAALVVASLGYATWGAAQEAATYRKAVARLTGERQARQAEAARFEQIKQERERQYQRIRMLKSDPLGGPPLAEIFKELSRAASDDLRLDRIVVARDGTGATMRVTGKVESVDLAQAQAEFNRFYFGLQRSPFFSEVIFNPPTPSKVIIQQGPSPAIEGRTAADIQARTHGGGEDREGLVGRGKKLGFELELRVRGVK